MKQHIRVLLIEDDEDDFIITQDILAEIPEKMYQLDWASNYESGLIAIKSNTHDVYLLDYRLGKENGLGLIKMMSEQNLQAPLILLTGQGDRELDLEAMKAGASDFIVKTDLSPELLDRSIRYAIQQFRTINQLRRKEEELQQLNIQLEQKVMERTSELKAAHGELTKALEKEKKLGELKSRFVSMASHEFKTPLTSILSSAVLIERYTETTQQEKRKKHIERIKSSVNNLTNILNDFLSLEKIESGGIKSNSDKINLDSFVAEILEETAPLLKPGQYIHYEHHGALELFIDQHHLKNILINLISNAIKYSNAGQRIGLKINYQNQLLNIEVTDQGIGIPEDDKEHMFEHFFRAANATNIQGTGLGLNIVKRYLDWMKGSIDFESQLGKGSTFKVKIPISTNFNNK
jgi:signal transduction histidine kinase